MSIAKWIGAPSSAVIAPAFAPAARLRLADAAHAETASTAAALTGEKNPLTCSGLNVVATASASQAAAQASAPPTAHHSTGLACSPRVGGVITSARQHASESANSIENRCVSSTVAAGRSTAILTAAVTAALVPASARAPAAIRGPAGLGGDQRDATATRYPQSNKPRVATNTRKPGAVPAAIAVPPAVAASPASAAATAVPR